MSLSLSRDVAPNVSLDATLQQLDQANSDLFENQRRSNLLRILIPTIVILTALSVPNAIYADVAANGIKGLFSFDASTTQVLFVLLTSVGAFFARRQGYIALASYLLIGGVSVIILIVLLEDTVLTAGGLLTLGAMPDFAYLLAPISLVCVLTGPRIAIAFTAATMVLTVVLIVFTPPDIAFKSYLNHVAGIGSILTVPLALQMVLAALLSATMAVLRRTQLQLSSARSAYEREHALDDLKNQFITSINHELRTPLMSLQGYLVLANEFGKAGDYTEQRRMFELGHQSMDHVNQLVESILDIRRIDTDISNMHPMPISLHSAVEHAITLLDPREVGRNDRPLYLHIPEHLTVLADEQHLSQVLVNLLANACKYSEPDAPITVSALVRAATAPKQSREQAAKPLMVEITVLDRGLGIPPEQIPLLFGRFVRLARDIASSVKGTGLGLALCKSYVEAMGGTIAIKSSGVPGEGSAFIFTLPYAAETFPASASPERIAQR